MSDSAHLGGARAGVVLSCESVGADRIFSLRRDSSARLGGSASLRPVLSTPGGRTPRYRFALPSRDWTPSRGHDSVTGLGGLSVAVAASEHDAAGTMGQPRRCVAISDSIRGFWQPPTSLDFSAASQSPCDHSGDLDRRSQRFVEPGRQHNPVGDRCRLDGARCQRGQRSNERVGNPTAHENVETRRSSILEHATERGREVLGRVSAPSPSVDMSWVGLGVELLRTRGCSPRRRASESCRR